MNRPARFLRCGRFRLSLERPLIMGIVNITPDSFSGDGVLTGGRDCVAASLERARAQREAGADILDLGAESTRPGSEPTALEEELDRLIPALEAMRDWNVPLSVDTCKPEVMQAALDAGADMVNDINALRSPGALEAVMKSDCGLCLMHMQGEPRNMQQNPTYDDVVGEVRDFLAERIRACRTAGIADERLALDPGFGFGKNLEHNLELFARLPELFLDGLPLLIGACRKRMLGEITGRPVDERLAATLATTVIAAEKGAKIIRVHDVGVTRDALAVWTAIKNAERARPMRGRHHERTGGGKFHR
ncbi:MAG: dihydropteroate synthase [Zoogloeaceae bacterium]|jgi:dihydropteroate synthase|nr:dihydropteroate synthase [Zoogloeaceae bacterium]